MKQKNTYDPLALFLFLTFLKGNLKTVDTCHRPFRKTVLFWVPRVPDSLASNLAASNKLFQRKLSLKYESMSSVTSLYNRYVFPVFNGSCSLEFCVPWRTGSTQPCALSFSSHLTNSDSQVRSWSCTRSRTINFHDGNADRSEGSNFKISMCLWNLFFLYTNVCIQ